MMMMMMMQGSSSSSGASTSTNILPVVTGSPGPRPPSSSSSSAAVQQLAEDGLFSHLAEDLTFTQDCKLETEQALMDDLMYSLRKEEKLLDADAWKYAAPRSQLHLTSLSGVRMAKDVSFVGLTAGTGVNVKEKWEMTRLR